MRLIRRLREFHPFTLLGAGVAAGTVSTLLARNFIPNERKISHRIELPCGVSDPQFDRSLGQLLGPPLLDGNRVTALQNGDEIFPAMLGARHTVGLGIPHSLAPRQKMVFYHSANFSISPTEDSREE